MTAARTPMIRILLADDHAQFRGCVRSLLARQPGLKVVASVSGGRAALRAMQRLAADKQPDLAIVDVLMKGMNGIETTQRLLRLNPALHVLALSSHDDPALVEAMTRAGCRGYMLKDDLSAELLRAIEALAGGKRYFSPRLGISEVQSPHLADSSTRGGSLS
jgi:DNA-binding NarL/FixJ family response regulator